MKNFILFIGIQITIAFSFFSNLSAQVFITPYESAYGTLPIEASPVNDSGNFNFYIHAKVWENEQFLLIVSNKGLNSFKEFMTKSKDAFLIEKEFAEKAQYKKMQKTLIESDVNFQGAFFVSKWFYNEAVKIKSTLSIYGDEVIFSIENVNEIFGERGQFVSINKFRISFENEEQINDFLIALDESKARKILSENELSEVR